MKLDINAISSTRRMLSLLEGIALKYNVTSRFCPVQYFVMFTIYLDKSNIE